MLHRYFCQNIHRYFSDIYDISVKFKYRYICIYQYFNYWLELLISKVIMRLMEVLQCWFLAIDMVARSWWRIWMTIFWLLSRISQMSTLLVRVIVSANFVCVFYTALLFASFFLACRYCFHFFFLSIAWLPLGFCDHHLTFGTHRLTSVCSSSCSWRFCMIRLLDICLLLVLSMTFL